MKNTVLKFKKEKIGKTRVSDYFSKDVYLADIKDRFPELKNFFKIGTIDDNYTIEALTNHVYSNLIYGILSCYLMIEIHYLVCPTIMIL